MSTIGSTKTEYREAGGKTVCFGTVAPGQDSKEHAAQQVLWSAC
jgi:hypothetical protein